MLEELRSVIRNENHVVLPLEQREYLLVDEFFVLLLLLCSGLVFFIEIDLFGDDGFDVLEQTGDPGVSIDDSLLLALDLVLEGVDLQRVLVFLLLQPLLQEALLLPEHSRFSLEVLGGQVLVPSLSCWHRSAQRTRRLKWSPQRRVVALIVERRSSWLVRVFVSSRSSRSLSELRILSVVHGCRVRSPSKRCLR